MIDRIREIKRLMTEISHLNAKILEHVYHRAWDRDLLRSLQQELVEKKSRLAELRTVEPRPPRQEAIAGTVADGGTPLTPHDTRLVANALYTQRPLIFESEEWAVYRRVCTSLLRLFDHELESQGSFDPVEFLVHCGLSLKDAEEIARRPGDFIRRSEDLRDG